MDTINLRNVNDESRDEEWNIKKQEPTAAGVCVDVETTRQCTVVT